MTKFEVAGIVLWLGGIAFGICIARARDMQPTQRASMFESPQALLVALDDITFEWPEHTA